MYQYYFDKCLDYLYNRLFYLALFSKYSNGGT